ncbi:MAG TPA: GNAT family N-acetyltransferase [Roseiflexaceae bacterium]|nr:GNAT family N-acetyltransferase [Roseiflexaceae bacterium]
MIIHECSQPARVPAEAALPLDGRFLSARGHLIVNRLVAAGDVDPIAELLTGLSARSLYLRYGLPMPRMSPESAAREAARLAQSRSAHHLSAVAIACSRGQEQVIGVAELAREPGRAAVPEIALVVADAYQREGIGSALCAFLVGLARREGLAALRAMALAENTAVRRMVARSGAPYTAETRHGMTTIQIDLRGASSANGLAAA